MLGERDFSHVGCLSLSVVLFEAEQERKRLQNIYIFVGLAAGSQNVRERESVYCLWKSQFEKMRECAISVSEKCLRMSAWKTRVYI